MSLTTIGKNGRVYERRFDHDEAKRLRASGWTWRALADRYGVCANAVVRVVDDRARARLDASTRQWMTALCDDCGSECTHNWSSKHGRHDRVVCRPCSMERRKEESLLSRMDENGDLLCSGCGVYRPMVDFVMRQSGSPRSRCRACETEARRVHRHANIEATRAWDREYKRRRRAEAAA